MLTIRSLRKIYAPIELHGGGGGGGGVGGRQSSLSLFQNLEKQFSLDVTLTTRYHFLFAIVYARIRTRGGEGVGATLIRAEQNRIGIE